MRLRNHWLALLFLSLGACSTEGSMTPVTGAGQAIAAAPVWSIDVTGADASRAEEIRDGVLERLIGSSLAQHVVPAGEKADRVLVIEVTRVRHVSSGERLMLGVMAGRNVIVATETVRNAGGPPLKVFTVDAESAAHPLSGESEFEDALHTFAEKTMDGLRS